MELGSVLGITEASVLAAWLRLRGIVNVVFKPAGQCDRRHVSRAAERLLAH